MFRLLAEQGHYAGRVKPTNTRQGIYACSPRGDFLASVNTRRADDMLKMLDRALVAWRALPEEARAPSAAAGPDVGDRGSAGWRFRQLYPEGGLVLRVHSRDLARAEDDLPADWRAEASNRDYAWFRAEEVRTLVPESLEVGSKGRWPDRIVRRIARLHLGDNVRGQVPAYADGDVARAEVEAEVVAADETGVTVHFSGSFRLEQAGRWAVDGYRDRDRPDDQRRGTELAFLGRARFDPSSGRLGDVEWVAAGERWGGTQYNGRGDDLDRSGIGFAFVEASPHERTEPAAFWEYGWR